MSTTPNKPIDISRAHWALLVDRSKSCPHARVVIEMCGNGKPIADALAEVFIDVVSSGERADDLYPLENLYAPPSDCRGCGGPLLPEQRRIADGCPCNSRRGINHGLVAKNTCTCVVCDPEQTGSTRYPVQPTLAPQPEARPVLPTLPGKDGE
jgi:hypothetical protein